MNKIAFVFPGQGSQSVGMLDQLKDYPEIATTFEQANQALDIDLLKMINQGSEQQLNQTQWTQPALLAASVAIFQIIKNRSQIKIDLMAGHSLGEYSALVCAGAIQFSDAVKLVHKRGQYMQQAVPDGAGAMAAVIGLDEQQINAACDEAQGIVSAANFNAPGQIVIAGEQQAVKKASELCTEKGAKRVIPLTVSVPSHCQLMVPAAQQLATELAQIDWQPPQIPVIHNVDVKSHQSGEKIRQALTDQLHAPVKWTQTMQAFEQQNIDTICECGPGKVLSGLFKRFNRKLNIIPLLDNKGITQLTEKQS